MGATYMEQVETLIVGAGVSGLAAAAAFGGDYRILEADKEIGGYCKTVRRDGKNMGVCVRPPCCEARAWPQRQSI